MALNIERDEHTGTDTTGHEWDGLKELNTPLPKWWLYTWLACILWALVYFVFFPSFPYGKGYIHGLLGASSRNDVMADVKGFAAERNAVMSKVAAASFDDIRKNPELLAAAQTAGRITFANNCQPCHGAGGAGNPGFPALAAGSWLWGGKLEDIQQTITHGIRSGDDAARDSQMPKFGTDGLLKPEEIQQVADYVSTAFFGLALKDAAPASIAAGKDIFAANCASCHGDNGEGNRDVGAPRLASKIHLYGGTRDLIVRQVTSPHMGVMPNWNGRLDTATIKSVAIYVHDLGGGE
ncbi:MAG: cytochrome-c oxidase, cbb3-type subunit III [Acetobacteraceae bacterium]|nr:cytochrome-c oxidase, cbb3-type subunit III [Acetobacteraceae bacterium]